MDFTENGETVNRRTSFETFTHTQIHRQDVRSVHVFLSRTIFHLEESVRDKFQKFEFEISKPNLFFPLTLVWEIVFSYEFLFCTTYVS